MCASSSDLLFGSHLGRLQAETPLSRLCRLAEPPLSLGAAAAAGAIVEMIIGNTVAAQINGALTQTTDAGAVEAAIVALGLVAATDAATNIYITLDDGTDTGIYRVTLDGTNAAANNIIDTVGEITSVVLVATLAGIADVGTLGSFNFA